MYGDRAMYERVYGEKYAEAKDLTTAQIAKLIREDIKAAVKLGVLPGTIRDYTVTTDTFAGGSAIRMQLLNHGHLWAHCTGDRNCYAEGVNFGCNGFEHEYLTEEGVTIRRFLQWLHGRYNYDGSDTMTDYFDVNYYGHADIETPSSADFRKRMKAEAEERKVLVAKITEHNPKHTPKTLRRYSVKALRAHVEKHGL